MGWQEGSEGGLGGGPLFHRQIVQTRAHLNDTRNGSEPQKRSSSDQESCWGKAAKTKRGVMLQLAHVSVGRATAFSVFLPV